MTAIRAACALVFLASMGAGGFAQDKKVVMTHVKYDGLKQEIYKHRGKVVLVDFWAHDCIPCRKAFPHILDMHRKYADKGLVVITVALERDVNEETVGHGNKFLTDKHSPFRSLLLDEPSELWKKSFAYESLPFYYVFDRSGKWVRYRAIDHGDKGVPYDEIERLIEKMLDEK